MVGCSYLGGTTFQIATTAPPSLKAAFIGASDLDKYAFVRNGGITAQFNTRPDEPPAVDWPPSRWTTTPTVRCCAPPSPSMRPTRRWARCGTACPIATAFRASPAPASGRKSGPTPTSTRCARRDRDILLGQLEGRADEPDHPVGGEPRQQGDGRPGQSLRGAPRLRSRGRDVGFFDHYLRGDRDYGACRGNLLGRGPDGSGGYVTADQLPGVESRRVPWFLAPARGQAPPGGLDPSIRRARRACPSGSTTTSPADYFAFWPHRWTRTAPASPARRSRAETLIGYPVAELTARPTIRWPTCSSISRIKADGRARSSRTAG